MSIAPGQSARYVVPKVHGDPTAARRMASAYRSLATAVSIAGRQVVALLSDSARYWSGDGHEAIASPLAQLQHDVAALVRVLDQVADDLDRFAARLERAHHHHGLSLGKLAKIGAVVAVSAAAIVVTVGAAGAVEAAAASTAVAEATEAASTATTAAASAAAGFFDSLDVLGALRPLLQFALPHLAQVEWSVGAVAGWDEATRGALDWREIGVSAGLTFIGGNVSSRVAAASDAAPAVVRHTLQASVWTGVSAADDEILNGRIDDVDLAESFVLAHGGLTAHDALESRGVLFHELDYRRAALIDGLRQPGRIVDVETAREMAVLRQPIDDLRQGKVDLYLHEGPGHTMARHVGQSTRQMRSRLLSERRVSRISTFWTDADARDTVAAALRQNPDELRRWLDDAASSRLLLRARLPYDIGMAVDRRGRVTFLKSAYVVLRRDATGVYVLTGFPRRVATSPASR